MQQQFQWRPRLTKQGYKTPQRQFTARNNNFQPAKPRNQNVQRPQTNQNVAQNPSDRGTSIVETEAILQMPATNYVSAPIRCLQQFILVRKSIKISRSICFKGPNRSKQSQISLTLKISCKILEQSLLYDPFHEKSTSVVANTNCTIIAFCTVTWGHGMYKVDCSIHTTRIDKGISSILGLDYFRFSVGCRRCLGAEAQCRTLFLFYFIYITNFACSGAFHSVVIFKSITQSFFWTE
jgi:hypothetical protein